MLYGLTKEIILNQRTTGDFSGRLSGLELVVNSMGIPTYEFMRPQIERSLTSHYMGERNFLSGNVEYGGYNVMTAGSGLSVPVYELIRF